jgi:hypothetical protein
MEAIRYAASGQIFMHLKDAASLDGAQRAAQASVAKVLSNPVGVALVAYGLVAAYRSTRSTTAAQPELPASVESYSASLAAYLGAARHETLGAEILDRLIADLDAVETESDDGTITIALVAEQWETLVGIVVGHTRTLAEANLLDLSNLPERANAQGTTIAEIRPYLEVQRELFRRAA